LFLIYLLDKNLNLKTAHRTQGNYKFLLGEYKNEKTNSSARYSMINRLPNDMLRALSWATLHWLLCTVRLHINPTT